MKLSIIENGNTVKFCSEKCKELLTIKSTGIKAFADRNGSLLHVTGVVTLKDVDSIYLSSASYVSSRYLAEDLNQTLDDENNTIVSMVICNGNLTRPFALCALRSLNACRLLDFFISSSFIPLDSCSYMTNLFDNHMVGCIRETCLTQKIIQKLEEKDLFSFIQDYDKSSSDSNSQSQSIGTSNIFNALPKNFQVEYPKSGSEFNCIQLPKQHQLLLHSCDDGIPGQMRLFLLCFGERYCEQSQEYPYVISLRIQHNKMSQYIFFKDWSECGYLLADGVIISGDGNNEVLSRLVENLCSGLEERGQQMVDSVLPDMFKKAGCRNIKALIYRAICYR